MDLSEVATTTAAVTTVGVTAGITLYKLIKREINKGSEKVTQQTLETLSFELQKLNGFVDALLEAMPYPAWVKLLTQEDGKQVLRMKYINKAYEETFNISRYQYIGKTDYEVWSKAIADSFYAHDMAIIGQDEAITFREPFRFDGDDHDTICTYQKLPINRDKYRGVIGFMYPEDWLKVVSERSDTPPELEETEIQKPNLPTERQ